MSQSVAEKRVAPFEISIGELIIIEKTVQTFVRPIDINGYEYAEDPETLLDVFENLLSEVYGVTEGLTIEGDDELIEFLVEGRAAYRGESGALFPTLEFKKISRDFLMYLKKAVKDGK